MRTITLTLTAAALACGGIAFAQAAPAAGPDHGPMGNITRAEAQAKAEKAFDRMDVNHDGVLNQADRKARMEQMFDKLDTNHDGAISREEFMAARQHMGHPGGEGGEHRMAADAPGEPGKPGKPGGKRMHRGGERGPMSAMMLMRMADPDHTGTVTKQAFVAAALAMFDRADADHDGVVTSAERKAAHEAMRAQRKERAGQWQARHQPDAQPEG